MSETEEKPERPLIQTRDELIEFVKRADPKQITEIAGYMLANFPQFNECVRALIVVMVSPATGKDKHA